MMSYKPLVFVLAVITATVLFAFKSQEPQKEYGTIQFLEYTKKDAITVTVNGELKHITTEFTSDEKKLLETLNNLAAEGWIVNSTDYASTGSFTKRIIYLERMKQ
jgi:hypothetical protein